MAPSSSPSSPPPALYATAVVVVALLVLAAAPAEGAAGGSRLLRRKNVLHRPTFMHMVDAPVRGMCSQFPVSAAAEDDDDDDRSDGVMVGGCSIWKITGCSAAAAAAAIACGGPLDPADAACILAAVSAISGCGECLCNQAGCPSWCPCDNNGDGNDDVLEDGDDSGVVVRLGECSASGEYTVPAGFANYTTATPGIASGRGEGKRMSFLFELFKAE